MQTQDMRIRRKAVASFPEYPELDEEGGRNPAGEEEAPPPNVRTEFSSGCQTSAAAEVYAGWFKVQPEYELRAPTAGETAHNPPAGFAAIYVSHFKCGLTLPLPPLVLSVLTHYNLALAQLISSGIFNLLRFIRICEELGVEPTLALFRHYFKIRKYSKHMEGFYTFASIKTKFVREDPPSSARETNSFLFFKTTENDSFSWNHSPITNVPLVGNESPSAQIIRKLEAYLKRQKRLHESEEEEWTDMPRRKKQRKIAECSKAPEPVDSRHQRPLQSEVGNATEHGKSLSVPSWEDMTSEQFDCSIQKLASSLSRLKIDYDHLRKVVDAQEKDLKIKGNEISLLQRGEVELQKVRETLEHNVKDRDKEIASLQEDKAELQTRNDLLLESKVSQLEGSVGVDKTELQKIKAAAQKMLGEAWK